MKNSSYSFDVLTNTVTISKDFASKASQLNTYEYKTLLQLRNDNPSMKIVIREGNKAKNGNGITFAQMEGFIRQCRDCESRLDTYERVKALSKVQRSPYKYVKDWFLANYANYSEQPEFDDEGFVVAKTKAQMEKEATATANIDEKGIETVVAASREEAAACGSNIIDIEAAAKEDIVKGGDLVSNVA